MVSMGSNWPVLLSERFILRLTDGIAAVGGMIISEVALLGDNDLPIMRRAVHEWSLIIVSSSRLSWL